MITGKPGTQVSDIPLHELCLNECSRGAEPVAAALLSFLLGLSAVFCSSSRMTLDNFRRLSHPCYPMDSYQAGSLCAHGE